MGSEPPSRADSPAGPDAAARLVRALLDPACYPHPTGSIELIETHISWVILTGQYAYKLKKPLKLPFLDFSTLERRLHFCREELRLNRRMAAELYIDVVPIGGTLERPRVGQMPPIEYALKLRQFDPGKTADRMLERGRIGRTELERFAEELARFHLDSAESEGRAPGRLAIENLDELEAALDAAGIQESLADLRRFTRQAADALEPAMAARQARGAVRELHGDLHLENLVLLNNALHAFDALEFDRTLRSVDVIDETAFLVMDLAAHGRLDLAHVFLNRYLEVTGDYSGAALLPFYLIYRALVRAKVRAIKARQAREAEAGPRIAPYLALARSRVAGRQPRLILTYGLSGSGKTTVTDALIPGLPAVRVRSDLERKRLHGVAPGAHDELAVSAGRYSRQASDRTYTVLETCADALLGAGLDVIVDATFLTRSRRAPFAALAERHGAHVAILCCCAPEAILRERVRRRAAARNDASEATEPVLDAQLLAAEPPTEAEGMPVVRIDTSEAVGTDAVIERLRHAASRRSRR